MNEESRIPKEDTNSAKPESPAVVPEVNQFGNLVMKKGGHTRTDVPFGLKGGYASEAA